MPVKKDQRENGRNRRKGDLDIAGPTTYRRADNISQGQRRKAWCGPKKARMRFGGLKVCSTDKEAVMGGGKEDIKGGEIRRWMDKEGETEKKLEVSVGLVRRRETPRRPTRDWYWGISRTVVGRAVGQDCRRARRQHTEVRSSYHFRVRTKLIQDFRGFTEGKFPISLDKCLTEKDELKTRRRNYQERIRIIKH
ncbi:hypothetical protein BY996DRAFT_6520539 [Phakopsora pachyrhizi]|nr:hypothetical protein BY996DRAFT_6520539 [Phakopsora pachyrhizi]